MLNEFNANSEQIKSDAREKERAAIEKEEKSAQKAKDTLAKEERKQSKIEEKAKNAESKRNKKFADDAMGIASIVFEDSKEISAGIAFVNTAQGVTKALAVQDYAGAAFTAVAGAAQISAILGASRGGGSASTVPARQPQQDFEAETSSLELSSATDSGSATQPIRFATDSGDELIDAIASALNKGQTEGRFV